MCNFAEFGSKFSQAGYSYSRLCYWDVGVNHLCFASCGEWSGSYIKQCLTAELQGQGTAYERCLMFSITFHISLQVLDVQVIWSPLWRVSQFILVKHWGHHMALPAVNPFADLWLGRVLQTHKNGLCWEVADRLGCWKTGPLDCSPLWFLFDCNLIMLYSKLLGEMHQRCLVLASVINCSVTCDSRELAFWVVDKSISYLFIFVICAETTSNSVPDVQPATL